jgi:alkyl hydroperoxide reductase subunit D
MPVQLEAGRQDIGGGGMMNLIERLRNEMPEPARDTKLNLQAVFQVGSLTPAQLWGTAVAAAIASRNRDLAAAVIADARAVVDEAVIEDAVAAATLMGMNNVYYRFRHIVGKGAYAAKPAKLRMNWIGKPRGAKADFELFSLAVSAINGCEVCVRSHEEKATNESGITDEQVHDAVRVASVIQASAVALEAGELLRAFAPAESATV